MVARLVRVEKLKVQNKSKSYVHKIAQQVTLSPVNA